MWMKSDYTMVLFCWQEGGPPQPAATVCQPPQRVHQRSGVRSPGRCATPGGEDLGRRQLQRPYHPPQLLCLIFTRPRQGRWKGRRPAGR
ncbi:hypothetical protein TNCV_2305231 [Trichonephila clavipes]|nr:hypothetical protein TNCV_2305231 [Trichonephila clavipes]